MAIASAINDIVYRWQKDSGKSTLVAKLYDWALTMGAELEKYREAANKSCCSYCGHIAKKDPDEILAHINECLKHPLGIAMRGMDAAAEEIAALRTDQPWMTGLMDRRGVEIRNGQLIRAGMRRGDPTGWTVERVMRRAGEWVLCDPMTGERMEMQQDPELREIVPEIQIEKEASA